MYAKHICLMIIAALVVAPGCATRHPVFEAHEKDPAQNGVYYALPYTSALVAVPVTKSTTKPGKFADLADDFFYVPDMCDIPVDKPRVAFRLGQPQITTVIASDERDVFRVQLKSGPFQRRALELKLSQLGLLTDATSRVEDKKLEVGLALVKTAAKVAGAIYGMQTPESSTVSQKVSLMIATSEVEETKEEIDWLRNRMQEAQTAVDQIKLIREKRINLLTADTEADVADKDTLVEMTKQLDAKEQELLSLFFGETKELTWTAQFIVDPGRGPEATSDLFYFTSLLGLRKADGIEFIEGPPPGFVYTPALSAEAATKIVDGIKPGTCAKAQEVELLKLLTSDKKALKETAFSLQSKLAPGMVAAVAVTHPAEGARSGFYYRVPAEGHLRLTRSDVKDDGTFENPSTVLRVTKLVSQYGKVVSVPEKLGSILMSNYEISLDETTGGVRRVKTDTEPITAAFIANNVDPAVQEVMNAVAAHAKLQAAQEAERETERATIVQALKDSVGFSENFGLTAENVTAIQEAIDIASSFTGILR